LKKVALTVILSFLVSSVIGGMVVWADPIPFVTMDPALIEYNHYAVGENFTIAVRIEDVNDLYALDIAIGWNTTWIEYTSHVVKIPVESYPDGILHPPYMIVKNEVNEDGVPGAWPNTMYWFAVTSMAPAPSFYGSGIAFEMNFRIKEYPIYPQPDVDFHIHFISTDMLPPSGPPILHNIQDCHVLFHVAEPYGPEAEFSAIPQIAEAGELVKFDASNSSAGFNGADEMPISLYCWDFGDGNQTCTSTPIIYHSFSDPAIYYVTLEVYAFGATPEKDSTTTYVGISQTNPPIGGYSFPIKGCTTTKPLTLYLALIGILTASFTIAKRRKKQQN
jgi:hypothetical protein